MPRCGSCGSSSGTCPAGIPAIPASGGSGTPGTPIYAARGISRLMPSTGLCRPDGGVPGRGAGCG